MRKAFLPERRADNDCEIFLTFRSKPEAFPREKRLEKQLYDLKTFRLLVYDGKTVRLTKYGAALLQLEDDSVKTEIANLALGLPKLQQAYEALKESRDSGETFEDALAPLLSLIRSDSYRKVAASVLKSWARFISDQLDGPDTPDDILPFS